MYFRVFNFPDVFGCYFPSRFLHFFPSFSGRSPFMFFHLLVYFVRVVIAYFLQCLAYFRKISLAYFSHQYVLTWLIRVFHVFFARVNYPVPLIFQRQWVISPPTFGHHLWPVFWLYCDEGTNKRLGFSDANLKSGFFFFPTVVSNLYLGKANKCTKRVFRNSKNKAFFPSC